MTTDDKKIGQEGKNDSNNVPKLETKETKKLGKGM